MGEVIDFHQAVTQDDVYLEKARDFLLGARPGKPRKKEPRNRKLESNMDTNAFAEAIVRLAPLLREYDREALFEIMYRLNMREQRERRYASNAAVLDPDNFGAGISENERAEVERRSREQVASLA